MAGSLLIHAVVGFVIAELSSVLFLWLYISDFWTVLWLKKNPGPGQATPRELVLMAIVIPMAFGTPIFLWRAQPDLFGPKSRLIADATNLGGTTDRPTEGHILLWSNGDLPARGFSEYHHGFVSPRYLTPDEIDAHIRKLTIELESGWATRSETNEVQPGAPSSVLILIENATDFDVQKFLKGEQYLYLIAVIGWDDEYLPPPKYRVLEFCRFFRGSLAASQTCPNHMGHSYIHN